MKEETLSKDQIEKLPFTFKRNGDFLEVYPKIQGKKKHFAIKPSAKLYLWDKDDVERLNSMQPENLDDIDGNNFFEILKKVRQKFLQFVLE